MTTAIRQIQTKQTNIIGVMASKPFVEGFNEVRANKPLRYDAYAGHNANQQWNYERGRLFAILFDGPLKKGRAVNRGAAYYFAHAIREKIIF